MVVHPIKYPDDGLDWEIKQAGINRLASWVESDWVIAVDADEFIWPPGNENRVKNWLSEQRGTVIRAAMWEVYRHKTDKDIDPTIPPMYQRRHGSPLLGTSYGYSLYVKPCIAKRDVRIQWDCGCHSYIPNPRVIVNNNSMVGAHWCMADPELAVKRRLAQRERQGRNNLAKGLGVQNHSVTEEAVRAECLEHENDPQLF